MAKKPIPELSNEETEARATHALRRAKAKAFIKSETAKWAAVIKQAHVPAH
jgi:hypothetical protein